MKHVKTFEGFSESLSDIIKIPINKLKSLFKKNKVEPEENFEKPTKGDGIRLKDGKKSQSITWCIE